MTIVDRVVASTLPFVPKIVVRQIAKRYIAGETIDDALRVAGQLNREGFRATLDILGEDVHNIAEAEHAAEIYRTLLEEIHRRKVDSTVSLKLTQFGLKIDKQACLELADSIVRQAAEFGNFVRIDMENSSCTSATLEVFRTLRKSHSNVGAVVQAYLRRTVDDVNQLADLTPDLRLCKGVYVESAAIAYRDMAQINRNYLRILETLLRRGSHVGIATHDEQIVNAAFRLIEEMKLPATAYEFQMLLGVQEKLRDRIRTARHPVRIYIPFGHDWYPYSVRRLRENPRLAGYVLKALITSK